MEMDEDDVSSSEEEDEEGDLDTTNILTAIAAIKAKDPSIYDASVRFFEELEHDGSEEETDGEETKEHKKKEKKTKPIRLHDHFRQRLLEEGPEHAFSDQDDVENAAPRNEVEDARVAFLAAAASAINDDDDSGGEDAEGSGVFTKKKKSEAELAAEESRFQSFVNEKKKEEKAKNDKEKESKILDRYFNDANLTESEKFLRDYLIQQQWLEQGNNSMLALNNTNTNVLSFASTSADDNRTSAANVAESNDNDNDNDPETNQSGGSDIDSATEADRFERQYNFRYADEQPVVQSYARTIESSVRVSKSQRKEERAKRKERKKMEKEAKMEELKRLKNLKKKEILKQLKNIQDVAGLKKAPAAVDFDVLAKELDKDDFDESSYDVLMSSLFGESYYQEGDDTKPVFGDEDEEVEAMLQADAESAETETQSKSKKEKKSKKSKRDDDTAVVVDKEATHKQLKESVTEYFNLGYEDLVGDLPTRFRYRTVRQNSFAMDPLEVIFTDQKELNNRVSIKKMAAYNQDEDEERIEKWVKKQKWYKEAQREPEKPWWERVSGLEQWEVKSHKRKHGAEKDGWNEPEHQQHQSQQQLPEEDSAARLAAYANKDGKSKKRSRK